MSAPVELLLSCTAHDVTEGVGETDGVTGGDGVIDGVTGGDGVCDGVAVGDGVRVGVSELVTVDDMVPDGEGVTWPVPDGESVLLWEACGRSVGGGLNGGGRDTRRKHPTRDAPPERTWEWT